MDKLYLQKDPIHGGYFGRYNYEKVEIYYADHGWELTVRGNKGAVLFRELYRTLKEARQAIIDRTAHLYPQGGQQND